MAWVALACLLAGGISTALSLDTWEDSPREALLFGLAAVICFGLYFSVAL